MLEILLSIVLFIGLISDVQIESHQRFTKILSFSGNTTHTDPAIDNGHAWWFVELGAAYRIFEINITNRFEWGERIDQANVFIDEKLIHKIKFIPGRVFDIDIIQIIPNIKFMCKVNCTENGGEDVWKKNVKL